MQAATFGTSPNATQPILEEGRVCPCPVVCIKTPHGSDRSQHFNLEQSAHKMSLTAKDKDTVKAFWAKIAGKADDIGTDALSRLIWPQRIIYMFNYLFITYLFIHFFTLLTQDAGGVPADQDLLLPLEGSEPRLCPGEEARTDRDGWSCWCCEEDRRSVCRSPEPQWAACLHSACGPR